MQHCYIEPCAALDNAGDRLLLRLVVSVDQKDRWRRGCRVCCGWSGSRNDRPQIEPVEDRPELPKVEIEVMLHQANRGNRVLARTTYSADGLVLSKNRPRK